MHEHKKRQLLKELLSPLVREWGYEEVSRCLSEFSNLTSSSSDGATSNVRDVADSSRKDSKANSPPPRRKLSPVDLVAKTHVPENRKSILMMLATQFERKAFLPTIGDVKNFLEMGGHKIIGINQRTEAFRRVLELFLEMPDEKLQKLAKSNAHGGPSELGPLSDAIKAAGAAVRSHDALAQDTDLTASDKTGSRT